MRILLGVNPGAQPSSAALNLLRRLGFANQNRAASNDLRGMLADLQRSTRRRQNTEANALRGLLSMSGQQAGAMQ
ncbi:MAG: hypothetical protein EB015_13100 [Methylocystaceae bacterium]|nr:hypothetical protein [Methylocystaceae bacterium]